MNKFNGSVSCVPEVQVPIPCVEPEPRRTLDDVLRDRACEVQILLRTVRAARMLAKLELTGVNMGEVRAEIEKAKRSV